MHRRRAHPTWAGPGAVELQALRTVAGSVAGAAGACLRTTVRRQAARTALDAFVRGVDLLRRQGDVRSGAAAVDGRPAIWPVPTDSTT